MGCHQAGSPSSQLPVGVVQVPTPLGRRASLGLAFTLFANNRVKVIKGGKVGDIASKPSAAHTLDYGRAAHVLICRIAAAVTVH